MNDNTIPCWHGQRLYETANEPKFFLWVNGAAHDDVIWVAGNQNRDTIRKFADKALKR